MAAEYTAAVVKESEWMVQQKGDAEICADECSHRIIVHLNCLRY